MSIRLLEVEGFKSLKEVSWRPGNLNVVIGPNGSGKSNLLQFMELLRASALGRMSERILQHGGIEALLWDGRAKAIKLRLEAGRTTEGKESVYFHYSLFLERSGPWSEFRVSHELLNSDLSWPEPNTRVEIKREKGLASIYDTRSERLISIEQGISEGETLLSTGSVPALNLASYLFRQSIDSWAIYNGIDTRRHASIRQPALTRREMVVDPDGENLISVLHTFYTEDRDFRNELNAAMRAAFSDNFEELIFPPAADQRVQLRVNWKHLKRSQPSGMLSDGTLRFLYLMAILANPAPPALIAIEEPEVGLHPSMFPIIAEYAAQAAQKTQVIFTTHSADFLDAFRHTGTTPTTTVTQWRDGATHLKVLEGDELAYWLREYTLGQLFRSSELEQIG